GSITGDVVSGVATANSGINFNRSDDIVFSGTISGIGYVAQYGRGTLKLTGNNTYGAYTTMCCGGTLAFSSDANVGLGDVKMGGGTVRFDASFTSAHNYIVGNSTFNTNGNTVAITGAVSTDTGAAGDITKIGAGTLILAGTNTASGSTLVSAGTLQIGNGGTAGTLGAGAVTNNAALVFNRAGTVNQMATISGTGSLTQSGSGTLNLFAAQTYKGATTITAGTLALLNGGSLAESSGVAMMVGSTFDITGITAASTSIKALTGNGTVLVGTKNLIVTAGTAAFAGTISGTGSFELSGGTTTLSGTTSNNITVNAGSNLQFGDGGTSGAVSGAVTNNGTVIFNRSDNITLPALGGTGALVQAGTGVLTVADDRTFSSIIVNAGSTLQIGNGGTTGTITGPVIANGTLVFNRSDATTFGVVVTGTGGLTQSGSGNLILTGTSTFTGPTVVNSGVLSVNGAISSTVIVNGGGQLGGNGTVGAITVASGGRLAPGNSIGTLNAASLTLAPGSTYVVEVSPLAADRINLTGAASLNGTLALQPAAGVYTATSYRLIQAGSVSGTFATVTGNSFAGLDTTIQYSATAVDLVLTTPVPVVVPPVVVPPAGVPPVVVPPIVVVPTPVNVTYLFNTYGRTSNQVAAGAGLTSVSNTAPVYLGVGAVVSTDTAGIPGALDQVSGEIHVSLLSSGLEDGRIMRSAVLDRMRNGRADSDISLWGSVQGGWGHMDGDSNAGALSRSNASMIVGADTRIDENWRAGVEAGYSITHANIVSLASGARFSGGQLGLYANGRYGELALRAGASYGFGDTRTTRGISAGSFRDYATATQPLDTRQLFGEAGYDFDLDLIKLEPFAGLSWT
ncbi:MAG: autotransporter domain-containing protein, partial [Pseudomonadota bacterium]